MRNRIKRVRERGALSLLLFAEAWVWLGLMRAALWQRPFAETAQRLGLQSVAVEPPPLDPPAPQSAAIGWAVRAAARYTPWESACLAQALACAWMLKRRRLDVVLYLGVRRDGENGPFLAHAWLRQGDQILTGGGGHESFAIVTRFQSKHN